MNNTERMISVAHELVALTRRDDEQLRQEVQLLTREFDSKEVGNILRFAAVVARAQAEQFENLAIESETLQ